MKLGITMEGGASRTLFSCGVTDLLLEENILPDYLIGVSAGIAFGVSYLSKQKGRNLEIAQKYMGDKRYMGVHHLFNKHNKSLYNISFVYGEIPNKIVPFDMDAFEEYKGKVVATVTNIHTGQAEYLEVPRRDDKYDVLIASCALPILFQPVKIGKRYYLDGGLSDSIPYKQAIKEGCDKNIVILTRERGYIKKLSHAGKVLKKMYKIYPNIVKALEERADSYNKCTNELYEAEKRGEVFIIEPETTYGVGRTETDKEKLTKLYQHGYDLTKNKIEELKKYLESPTVC